MYFYKKHRTYIMKKIIFTLVVLSLMSFTTFAQDNWNTLKSETGKFEAAITGTISEQSADKEKSSSFKITFDADNMYYLISSTKHKSELESGIDELLEVSISTFSEQVKATISNRKEVFLENAKGLYAEMDMTEMGFKLEYYVFMHDVYQYQVVTYAAYESYDAAVANRFFKSFKVLE